MKIVILLLAVSAIQISAEECVGKKKVRLEKGLTMRCQGGVWKAVQRKSAHASKPCEDNPELSANGTCSADRGHCQQFTQKGSEMDRSCPGTCNSCDACNCQDSHLWHTYCSYWTQYCQDPGVLGTWMTSNCRKTCGKCRCPCCSYRGTSHALGSRINLPQQCGVLECQEALIAGDSNLLPGAKEHDVSHPEELTLNFLSLHDGADCCLLPEKAKRVDGTEFDKDAMVEEGWGGSILMPKGPVQAHCCHGTMSVALEDVESVSTSITATTSTSSSTTTPSTYSTTFPSSTTNTATSNTPKNQLPVVFRQQQEFVIQRNKLVTELEYLGKEYILSFDLLLNTLDSGSVLHLTLGGDNGVYGDRTPGIWLFHNMIHIASAINGVKNFNRNIQPPKQTGNWMHFEISQELIDSKYMFEVKIDDTSYWVVENNAAASFKKIQVFGCDDFYGAVPGKIKNLEIQTKAE